MTKIEWTEKTWNPIVGCSIVSPGCTNCYAMKMAHRLQRMGRGVVGKPDGPHPMEHYDGTTKVVNGKAVWTGNLNLAPEHILLEPLKRRKPTMWFVNSMSDLFHDDVPDEWIDRVFAVMGQCDDDGRGHTFQVLTKRSSRMLSYMSSERAHRAWNKPRLDREAWPPRNVWLGVSAERQPEWDARTYDLRQTPAAIRFVSGEPLLGPIECGDAFNRVRLRVGMTPEAAAAQPWAAAAQPWTVFEPIDWVIVGGESGPGARPMHPDWARSIRDQCLAAGVAFFFKQWGLWKPLDQIPNRTIDATAGEHGVISRDGTFRRGHDLADPPEHMFTFPMSKKAAGRLLDGREHNEMPAQREAREVAHARMMLTATCSSAS